MCRHICWRIIKKQEEKSERTSRRQCRNQISSRSSFFKIQISRIQSCKFDRRVCRFVFFLFLLHLKYCFLIDLIRFGTGNTDTKQGFCNAFQLNRRVLPNCDHSGEGFVKVVRCELLQVLRYLQTVSRCESGEPSADYR